MQNLIGKRVKALYAFPCAVVCVEGIVSSVDGHIVMLEQVYTSTEDRAPQKASNTAINTSSSSFIRFTYD